MCGCVAASARKPASRCASAKAWAVWPEGCCCCRFLAGTPEVSGRAWQSDKVCDCCCCTRVGEGRIVLLTCQVSSSACLLLSVCRSVCRDLLTFLLASSLPFGMRDRAQPCRLYGTHVCRTAACCSTWQHLQVIGRCTVGVLWVAARNVRSGATLRAGQGGKRRSARAVTRGATLLMLCCAGCWRAPLHPAPAACRLL